MRAARSLLAGLALLLVLTIGAVAVVPPMLDWDRYRGTIAALASSAIGHPVRIGGAVTLAVLPEPMLTATGIAVDDGSGRFVLTARALRLRVGLAALLRGRIDARELVLNGAALGLAWPPGFRPDVARLPAWLTGLQARVENSRATIGRLDLTAIEATLARDPLTGTFAASGSAVLEGRPWQFTARLSPPGRDGSAALELAVDGQGPVLDSGGRFSGQMAADGSFSGRVSGRGPDLSRLLPAPAIAWNAEGRLSVAGGLALADDLALDLGGSPARGAVAFRVSPAPRLDLALAASRIDLDRWLPVLGRGGPVVPTGIDLSAEAATLAGGTLRHLRAAFDSVGTGIVVREATATLPGDASLSLSGRMVRDAGGEPGFAGALRLAAPELPATLRWLAALGRVPLGGVPPGALRRLDLAGSVDLRQGEARLTDMRGMLDGATLGGDLAYRAGERPVIRAALALGRLDLDPWLADGPASLPHAMSGADLDIRLATREAVWRGTAIRDLALEAGLGAEGLTVRSAEAAVDGVHAVAAGKIGADGRLEAGRLDLTTADIAAGAPLLPAAWHLPAALLRGPAHLRLAAAGRPAGLAFQLGLDLGDARLEADPVLDLATLSWSGSVTLRHPGAPRLLQALGLPEAAAWVGDGSLALRADLAGTPASIAAEHLDLTAGLMHVAGNLAARPGPRLSGQISAERLPIPLPRAHGTDPLPPLAWLAGVPGLRGSIGIEAGAVLAGPDVVLRQAAAKLVFDDRTLRVEGITGAIGDGRLAGTIVLDAAREPPRVHADGGVSGLALSHPLFGLPLDLAAGTLDMRASLDAEGHSPAALLATLRGTAEATLANGRVTGFDLAGLQQALAAQDAAGIEPAAAAMLAGGQSAASRLSLACTISGGALTLTQASLESAAGTAQATGSVDLAGRLFDLHLRLHPGEFGPELGLLLSGPMVAPHRVPELAGLTAWLAGRAAQP